MKRPSDHGRKKSGVQKMSNKKPLGKRWNLRIFPILAEYVSA
jgi:hypothetical protein